ncbi:Hypothetical_protein [Hexamita inflata]|uniref:Hypothetical_protein n=1 Tax=Hexamita inflata TaxID=28002 RepID=A0AA86NDV1_9EUKA|nr:Hypothetical protein HINF_LOCUS5015 [Hexamita inflata]
MAYNIAWICFQVQSYDGETQLKRVGFIKGYNSLAEIRRRRHIRCTCSGVIPEGFSFCKVMQKLNSFTEFVDFEMVQLAVKRYSRAFTKIIQWLANYVDESE